MYNIDHFSFGERQIKGQQTYETQMHELLAILRLKAQPMQTAINKEQKNIACYLRWDAVAPVKGCHARYFFAAGCTIALSSCLTNFCGRLDHDLSG
jgi:hypothetical protein